MEKFETMETMELNFECTYNHKERMMTCEWAGGRVKLAEAFRQGMTFVEIEGEVKARYDNLTVEQFMKLQCKCQEIANGLQLDTEILDHE